ncbi:MAG: AAA family ATPase [Burkholderiales bacterium]|nr:AAA family ATPase [Burkholderiales bacterium]
MRDAVEQFRAAIRDAGLHPPEMIATDGKLHRFPTSGRRSDDAGWYVFHNDGIPAGAFGDWRGGMSETWRADVGRTLSTQEEAAYCARVDAMRRERAAEDARSKAEAREKAAAIWQAASLAPDEHPYLAAKGVRAHALRVHDGALVVPMREGAELHSLQFIEATGDKRFLAGGRVSGCYFPIGKPEGTLCIAEGYATGASIHDATGYAVAAAFFADNLLPVARTLRARFPKVRLVICADDDAGTPGNPGLSKAISAARATGALVAVPDFGSDRPEKATDFNDLARLRGADAVRSAVAAAHAVRDAESTAASARSPAPASSLILVRADALTCEPVRWLWPGWLARAKFHVLAGAPGAGKTTAAMAIAATLTRGGRWPDGSSAERGDVLIATYEDDPADTLVPRLHSAGADLSRVRFIDGTRNAGRIVAFRAGEDASLLADAIRAHDVRLVIVDPVISALGSFDSHRNAETRQALQPLADVAMQTGVAILGIAHFSKGTTGRDPLERVNGSLAFGALARIVLAAAKVREEDGTERRIFARVKSNIGPDDGGFAYTLGQVEAAPGVFASRVVWGEALEGNARELLAEAVPDADGDAPGDVEAFVRGCLADGPVSARQMRADASGAGYSWDRVRRAAVRIGVDRRKGGMKEGWTWRLSEPVRRTQTPEECAEECEESTHASLHSSHSSAPPSNDFEVL